MEIFIILLLKILPLYFFILLGFFSGKFLKTKKESVASLLIYILTPIIVFHGIVTTRLSVGVLVMPFIFWIIGSLLCILFYTLGKNLWQDTTKNILAYTSGTGNIGYFGLPVAVAMFGESAIGAVALAVLGFVLYENTLGFYITARGHHTVGETFEKLVRLPSIYTFILGIAFNLSGITLPASYFDTVLLVRGAYTVLGMMLIGVAVSEIHKYVFDVKFILLSFLAKFILWPVLILLFVYFDRVFFHSLNPIFRSVLVLLSATPLAANTVAWSTLLRTQPEKSAVAVLLSTVISLLYIPFIVILFIK